MPLEDKTRLRVTPWPGVALALPSERWFWHPYAGWKFGPHGGIWGAGRSWGREGATPPLGESYLELAALDLENNASIHGFVERWGVLGVRWKQDPVTGERIEVPDYSHLVGIYPTFGDQRKPLSRSVKRARQDVDEDVEILETTTEFRFGATLIRDLLRAWRWQRGETDGPGKWESPLITAYGGPNNTDSAAEFVDDLTHGLLSAFYPQFLRVEIDAQGQRSRAGLAFAGTPLLNIMALELYNHACARAEYKTCHNEPCGRLFVHQRGRAQQGQHRAHGVLYCSYGCARAQAQRQYRRRQRAGKGVATWEV